MADGVVETQEYVGCISREIASSTINSLPVDGEVIKTALDLLECLPDHVFSEYMDIEETDMGSIDFEWTLENDVRLNMLVLEPKRGIHREIGWACMVGDDSSHGGTIWNGKLTPTLDFIIAHVFKNRKQYHG